MKQKKKNPITSWHISREKGEDRNFLYLLADIWTLSASSYKSFSSLSDVFHQLYWYHEDV